VALSLGLLTAGGIFARTAITASGGNPGYAYDRLLLASLDNNLGGFDETRGRANYAAVLDRVRALPGVSIASMTSTLPFGDTQQTAALERVGVPGTEPARARTYRVIGADHFAALGLRMIRGREFTRAEEESASAPRVAIIDEALARRLFEGDDPIGQMIRVAAAPGDPESTRGEPMQVIGIAPPLIEELLDRAPVPHIYVPFGREYRAAMHLEVRLEPGADERAGIDALRAAMRASEPRLPVLTLSSMQAFHDQGLELWALRTGAQLFTVLGGLALLLAVVGVYGVKSYIVAQRTREIGIRMALGASGHDVVRLVLRDGLFLTGAGVALGVPLAVVVSFALAAVFVDVGGFDGLVISVATVVLAVAATIASAVPARRASRIQPLRALQGD